MRLILLSFFLFTTVSAHAGDFYLIGLGLDGKDCVAKGVFDNKQLHWASFEGAVKRTEIDPAGRGEINWKTSIRPTGASRLLALADESPTNYSYFKTSGGWISSNITFSFDSDRVPEQIVPTGSSEEIQVRLTYSGDQLKKITAKRTERALYNVVVEEEEFSCQVAHGNRIIE